MNTAGTVIMALPSLPDSIGSLLVVFALGGGLFLGGWGVAVSAWKAEPVQTVMFIFGVFLMLGGIALLCTAGTAIHMY